ncbi:TPA: hypothetical protein NJ316_004625 [Vibrio parahaemolyticus]|nr:hypothetical protein [Vibrio parahaemolyticus]HCE3663620.1 hypothetical protein [Vibrio parahaemolyticus]HCG5126738.1 hypothetical protein [Vibrio parahaemolyticus]HCG5595492.1 hypothetical protein [Vibrio parahaemolyticus]HCG6499198.1 hypothetical protein [Vibrio parahaemolyticus]
MKWIIPLFIFTTVVYLLKQIEPNQPIKLTRESVVVISYSCKDVWRTSNLLNITFNLKSGEYSFRARLKDAECEQFNKKVKIGSLANVVYFPAGYKRFSLLSIEIDGRVWVHQ